MRISLVSHIQKKVKKMLSDSYYYWLINQYGGRSQEDIYGALAGRDYIWQISLDAARASDGVSLRSVCAYKYGVQEEDIASGPCSCLEMLCALSDMMVANCDGPDNIYFMNCMIDNIGLRTSRSNMQHKIDIWLNREYDADGKGSPIWIRGCQSDLRHMSVWDQMLLYLNTYVPFDNNYLRR